jgi:hypothetical protein
VRATLLAAVDPAAEELQPLKHPRLLVAGLMTWTTGAAIAGTMVFAIRALELSGVTPSNSGMSRRLGMIGAASLVASLAGSLVLIRPHRGTPAPSVVKATIGVVGLAGVVLGYAYLHLHLDPSLIDPPYSRPGTVVDTRVYVRLVMGACIIFAMFGLRPNARMLAARSLVMRTGRVDRQSMYALASATGVAMVGDVIQLAPVGALVASYVPWSIGAVLIAVGSLLLLVGLFGLILDSYRVSRALLEPVPSMRQVLHGRAEGPSKGAP